MPLYNGSNVVIYNNDIALGHSTNAVLSMNLDLPITTNKNSGGWAECLAGKRSVTRTVEDLEDYSDQMNNHEFVNL